MYLKPQFEKPSQDGARPGIWIRGASPGWHGTPAHRSSSAWQKVATGRAEPAALLPGILRL